MIRAVLMFAALVIAGPVAAQEWAARMSLTGEVAGVYEISGTRNSIFSDAKGIYMSAEAYAEGVDAGVTCQTANAFEIDYFFGDEAAFGGHILFTMERRGTGYVANDPALFFDALQPDGEIIDTYADFDASSVAIVSAECLPDGRMDMAVNFKGRLLSDTGMGPQSVQVSGTAEALLILKDMNEY